ncbi:MAG: UMP kinase [Gammaproteobacteria bacterium RIFCSPHIGHO2_12_FULL_41_20]|nr:MAG: UMP kinase [Gammaproteobacteria bacterium RIFCSPHIGHO2_12_FULL_41_20]
MEKPSSSQPIYKRILLKLSGEALQGDHLFGIDASKLSKISQEIINVAKLGIQVAIVIGGGNLVRGADLCATGLDRVSADQMGMLATVINGLALRDALERKGMAVALLSALGVPGVAHTYDRALAQDYLQQGKLVVFVAGTGNPLVTTDSAAALRGIEIGADVILKATKVDGVFTDDPIKNPKAERYLRLTYNEVLEKRLGVMDLTAILLCQDHGLPLRVFNMNKQGALQRIMLGEQIGTFIEGEVK